MNIILLTILIFTCSISILFGLRYSQQFISAMMHNKNMIKYKKYLIFAFLYLFIIPLALFFLFTLLSSIEPNKPSAPIQIKTNQYTSNNGYFTTSSQEINIDQNQEIQLTIKNKYHLPKEFTIDITCGSTTCEKLIKPQQNKVFLYPSKTFILPITINLKETNFQQNTKINISLIDKEGNIYDSIPLTLI